MTIKEFYNWAKMSGIEDYKLEINWLENTPNYSPDLLDIKITDDDRIVIVLP